MDEGLLGQVGQGLQGEKCLTWSGIWMRVCLARLVRVCGVRSTVSVSHLVRYVDEGLLGQVGQGLQGENDKVLARIARQQLQTSRPVSQKLNYFPLVQIVQFKSRVT
jgi:hypothetical protein